MPRKTSRKTSRKVRGGQGSAASYGTYVWGTGNQQHAISPDSNVIAPVNDPATYKGGSLTATAVPILLIAANQMYKPKRAMKKGGAVDLSSMVGNINSMNQSVTNAMGGATPTPIPTLVQVAGNLNPPPAATLKGGSKKRMVGSGVLTNIAVPAVLMAANHLYKPRRTKKLYRK